MLYENNYIEKLLRIKVVILKNIEENDNSIAITFKLEVKEHICPYCGQSTTRIHDYRVQTIKVSFENTHISGITKEDMCAPVVIKYFMKILTLYQNITE